MIDTAAIALRTYLAPLTSARAFKLGILMVLGFLGLLGLALVVRPFTDQFGDILEGMREWVVVPGVSIAAVLLSEIPLRDGIRHRTLLYPLLGPVPRRLLAMVRTLATAGLLGIGAALLLGIVTAVGARTESPLWREIVAAFLGAGAYVGIFGLIHIVTRRGLIGCLALIALFDYPLGRLPFAIRNLSPSYHVRTVAGHESLFQLPIEFSAPASSIWLSILMLLLITAVTTWAAGVLFARRNLGELC